MFSEGASGAFTCFSSDKRYMIKTLSHTDTETLEDICVDYAQHLAYVGELQYLFLSFDGHHN